MIPPLGVLRNTRPLNYSESHSYVLSIVAEDCGEMKSSPVLVIVEVRPPCHTGWSVVASQISYVPSTGPQPLFPQVLICTFYAHVQYFKTGFKMWTCYNVLSIFVSSIPKLK